MDSVTGIDNDARFMETNRQASLQFVRPNSIHVHPNRATVRDRLFGSVSSPRSRVDTEEDIGPLLAVKPP